ncbi:hypothetical protein RRG08_057082 [Elysia crispata]|uniref:Uncharacterized protein n=1 Tax=Elysia crispata TaxID=231223 RepID=A0AAE1AN11_9GAST|nr:hypothetical protein RRG08_057082 [Elysia crispata]
MARMSMYPACAVRPLLVRMDHEAYVEPTIAGIERKGRADELFTSVSGSVVSKYSSALSRWSQLHNKLLLSRVKL